MKLKYKIKVEKYVKLVILFDQSSKWRSDERCGLWAFYSVGCSFTELAYVSLGCLRGIVCEDFGAG